MRIIVTGGSGFIGRNLCSRLREKEYGEIVSIEPGTTPAARYSALVCADFVFHLAGVNRPLDSAEYDAGNRGFTALLCSELLRAGRRVPIAYTSSIQALLQNPYGVSKRAAEMEIDDYGKRSGASSYVLRLANVFGKWCRPNYNSAVATFCHNIVNGLPLRIDEPLAPLKLMYIDDVVDVLESLLLRRDTGDGFVDVTPVYETTVGQVADHLNTFAESRRSLVTARVGNGLVRALYATYMSYLRPNAFAYPLVRHADARGVFTEMLRTPDCGQISFFTAMPGVTRGGHYHHTKTEKFLVVKGSGRFRFRNVLTGERAELVIGEEEARVVETVPGWIHDVTNVGDEELVVMLWANEQYDPERPDTIVAEVTQ